MAYVITEIIKNNFLSKADVTIVFEQNAADLAQKIDINENSPQGLFNRVFDYMLEGMPCDRVNEIVENNETNITWKTTFCLHKDYWDEVDGDIENFYHFRSAWISSFLAESKSEYVYNRTEAAYNTIKRM